MAEEEEKKQGFKLPGTGWRRSLLAVLIGNLIYFASVDYMPDWAVHRTYMYDVGLAIDFWICVLVYILIRLLFPKL